MRAARTSNGFGLNENVWFKRSLVWRDLGREINAMLHNARQEHERHRSLRRVIRLVDQARSGLRPDKVDGHRESEFKEESAHRILEDTRKELTEQLKSMNER